MMKKYALRLLSLLVIFSVISISCGKDPASSSKDDIPALPEILPVEPDLSYFENEPAKLPAAQQLYFNNYTQAQFTVIGLALVSSMSSAYMGMFRGIDTEDAEFKDGKWVWGWSYGYGGDYIAVKYTGEEKANSFEWNMFWSFKDSEEGTSIDNYRVISGEVAKDGKSGGWKFYNYGYAGESNQDLMVFSTEWTKESDTRATLKTTFYDDEDGTLENSYSYEQNDAEFLVKFTSPEESSSITIYWNTDTMTGYYQEGSDASTRLCWDDTFHDTACN